VTSRVSTSSKLQASGLKTIEVPGVLFWRDIKIYAGRVREFSKDDWVAYILWVGLMVALFVTTFGFLLIGHYGGVVYPPYVWNVPFGVAIFTLSIGFDTIGHRTVYKEELKKAEALVHHVTIFAGIGSCVVLSVAYTYPQFLAIPALVLVFLSILYSIIDEAMHWIRYAQQKSDRVEMWSHFGIFLGHLIFICSWSWWFLQGYPGVTETLKVIVGR
jgi:hypothetical protein